jgi:hypothetical protein
MLPFSCGGEKFGLGRFEPVLVDLQGFNLGVECGGRNAEFGSSA